MKPNYAETHYNRGVALQNLKRPEEALASYDKAIALKPDDAEAYNNRGNALNNLKRFDEALASYDKAVALKPDYVETYYNRGIVLREPKRGRIDKNGSPTVYLDQSPASLRLSYAESIGGR